MSYILTSSKKSLMYQTKNKLMCHLLQTVACITLFIPRNLFIGLSIFLCLLNVNGDDRAILCIVKAPLSTPFYNFYEDKNATCLGCLFPIPLRNGTSLQNEVKKKSIEVIETSLQSVQLVINLTNSCMDNTDTNFSMVFVLVSQKGYPTVFIVSQLQHAKRCKFTFVACGNVTILAGHTTHTILQRADWYSENVLSRTTGQFGFVSSFTNAVDANTIIFVGNTDYTKRSQQKCHRYTSEQSPVATCSVLSKQTISGCYYQNRMGQSNKDVHIIDIDHKNGSGDHLLITVNGIDANTQPRPQDSSMFYNVKQPLKRNLTLVICSKKPISLAVHVQNIDGLITFLVGGNDQVENISPLKNNVTVSVKKVELPNIFDALLLYILSTVGLPVSYVRTTSPSVIDMIVSSFAGVEDSDALVKSNIVLECLSNGVLVAIGRAVAERAGVSAMSLSDTSCFSKTNDSHVFLSSKFDVCGFHLQSNGDGAVYSNIVYVDIGDYAQFESDDEDFMEGSGLGSDFPSRTSQIQIAVQCKLHDHYTPQTDSADDYTYRMSLYKDAGRSVEYRVEDFPLTLLPNRYIYVELSFVTTNALTINSHLRLLVEECFLSNSPTFNFNSQTLIRKSCPVKPSVRIDSPNISNELHFQFKVPESNHPREQHYLHCEVGLCSTHALPNPSLVKCVDPRSYCGKDSLLTAFSNQFIVSNRQSLVAGPISVRSTAISSSVDKKHSDLRHPNGYGQFEKNFFNTKQPAPNIVVVEGLSTQAVVGIAILSFFLGIGLMGTLWIIYTKTDPGQQRRPESNVSMGLNYEIDANSDASTPSSDVPMTA